MKSGKKTSRIALVAAILLFSTAAIGSTLILDYIFIYGDYVNQGDIEVSPSPTTDTYVLPGWEANLLSTTKITLYPGFHAQLFSHFTAAITECGKPSYDDEFWEASKKHTNCYNYAMNVQFSPPSEAALGLAGGMGICYTNDPCNNSAELLLRAIADGLVFLGTNMYADCPGNEAKVALFYIENVGYHWLRQDYSSSPPLYWSHKPGNTSVTDLDDNGDPITEPHNANFNHWEFLYYFCVCSDEVEGEGHENIM